MAAFFVVYCVSVSAITAPKPIPSMPFPQCRSPKAVSPKRASNLGGVFCAFPAMSMAGKRCANCWSTMCHCQSSLLQLPAAGLQCHRRRYRGVCQPKSALCHLPKVIVAPLGSPIPHARVLCDSFGSLVPKRLVSDLPCRAFQRGWFHQTRQNWRVW